MSGRQGLGGRDSPTNSRGRPGSSKVRIDRRSDPGFPRFALLRFHAPRASHVR